MSQATVADMETLKSGGDYLPTLKVASCYHCGLKTNNPIFEKEDIKKDRAFCCNGCRNVFNIIKATDLEKYYQIKKNSSNESSGPVISARDNYKHFDEKNFKDEYVSIDPENGNMQIKLYLEGVHCIACLWLIENTPKILKTIISAELDFDNSLAVFSLKKGAMLSELGVVLNKLGYVPHSVKNDDEIRALKVKEERDYLIKIGIAMACMGNILLFSISIYAGLEGTLKKQFEWLSFFISLPVLLYSALPFYKLAFSSLMNKRVNIDLPISIALLAGGLGGLYSLLTGHGETYFDSLTSLVFLLLLSRYALLKIKQRGIGSSSLEYFSSFGSVKILADDDTQSEIMAKYLERNSRILVSDGEMIPADGEVLEGEGFINTSLLTGESTPIRTIPGSKVFSGTQVIAGKFKIKTSEVGPQTRLGHILSEVKRQKSSLSPIATLSEKISRYFVSLVMLTSLAICVYFFSIDQFEIGAMRALTLLIITCPCALALATPLALTSALQKLSRKGIIVRSEEVIEKLAKSDKVFLDKTGTLTKGIFQVISWDIKDEGPWEDIVWSLEHRANHPVAMALKNYISSLRNTENRENTSDLVVTDWVETPGVGVSGIIENHRYEIKRYPLSDTLSTGIALYQDGTPVLKILLRDDIRIDSEESIKKLKDLGITSSMVSGDNQKNVENVARFLGIEKENTFFDVTPKGKLDLIKKYPLSVMVGDGANDAMALKEAEIGIAVKGSIDISLEAADIYLSKTGVSPLVDIFEISRASIKIIKRNMAFSLLYNIVGASLAISGIINPLWAAVLMPVSSLTVLLSTVMWKREDK